MQRSPDDETNAEALSPWVPTFFFFNFELKNVYLLANAYKTSFREDRHTC